MKPFESLPPDAALRRLVIARVAAGIIVLTAVITAPPVADSIATLNLSSAELAELIDDDAESFVAGVDAHQTQAAPVEPLTSSF